MTRTTKPKKPTKWQRDVDPRDSELARLRAIEAALKARIQRNKDWIANNVHLTDDMTKRIAAGLHSENNLLESIGRGEKPK